MEKRYSKSCLLSDNNIDQYCRSVETLLNKIQTKSNTKRVKDTAEAEPLHEDVGYDHDFISMYE